MADAFELGPAVAVEAESVGVPGQRRFRLRAMNDNANIATVWLEKEQLVAVGEAIDSTLKEEGYRHRPRCARRPGPAGRVAAFPGQRNPRAPAFPRSEPREQPNRARRIGRTGRRRRYVERFYRNRLLSRAAPAGADHESVVSAGRPLCPLCTAPMDPAGHVCVRTNGHHPH